MGRTKKQDGGGGRKHAGAIEETGMSGRSDVLASRSREQGDDSRQRPSGGWLSFLVSAAASQHLELLLVITLLFSEWLSVGSTWSTRHVGHLARATGKG